MPSLDELNQGCRAATNPGREAEERQAQAKQGSARRDWRFVWPAETHVPVIARDWQRLEDGRIQAGYTTLGLWRAPVFVGRGITPEQIPDEWGDQTEVLASLPVTAVVVGDQSQSAEAQIIRQGAAAEEAGWVRVFAERGIPDPTGRSRQDTEAELSAVVNAVQADPEQLSEAEHARRCSALAVGLGLPCYSDFDPAVDIRVQGWRGWAARFNPTY